MEAVLRSSVLLTHCILLLVPTPIGCDISLKGLHWLACMITYNSYTVLHTAGLLIFHLQVRAADFVLLVPVEWYMKWTLKQESLKES